MEDEDDTQYMLAQDPGYLEWMEEQRRAWEDSLEKFLDKLEFEEDLRMDMACYGEFLTEPGYTRGWDDEKRKEELYWTIRDDMGNEDE